MALIKKVRTDGDAVAERTDLAWRMLVVDHGDGVKQVWVEWQAQKADGRYEVQSHRCSATTEAEILALPNFGLALSMAADDTHPKVSA